MVCIQDLSTVYSHSGAGIQFDPLFGGGNLALHTVYGGGRVVGLAFVSDFSEKGGAVGCAFVGQSSVAGMQHLVFDLHHVVWNQLPEGFLYRPHRYFHRRLHQGGAGTAVWGAHRGGKPFESFGTQR